MNFRFLLFTFFLFVLSFPYSYGSKTTTDTNVEIGRKLSYTKRDNKIKVYVEGTNLDMDYMRRNMRFVDFVNEPAVADVHIIISERRSGSGGSVYSLMYNNKTFENFNEFTITATTASSDTFEEERKKLRDAISMGLMPFVNQTTASKSMVLRYKKKQDGVQVNPTNDPWNNWTFRGDVSGNIDLEESRETYNYSFNLRADQVTEEWRIRNMARRSVRTRKYTNDGDEYSSDNTSNYVTSSVVKSLS